MSQEDAAHLARVHEADKEQLVKHDKKDQARFIKILETWKEKAKTAYTFLVC